MNASLKARILAGFALVALVWGSSQAQPPTSCPDVARLIGTLKAAQDGGEAAYALGKLGECAAPAIPALIAALQNPDQISAAIEALGDLGATAEPAVPALAKIIQDRTDAPCGTVHFYIGAGSINTCAYDAIIALGKIGPAASAAVPALKELAETHPFPPLLAWFIRHDNESTAYPSTFIQQMRADDLIATLRSIGTPEALLAATQLQLRRSNVRDHWNYQTTIAPDASLFHWESAKNKAIRARKDESLIKSYYIVTASEWDRMRTIGRHRRVASGTITLVVYGGCNMPFRYQIFSGGLAKLTQLPEEAESPASWRMPCNGPKGTVVNLADCSSTFVDDPCR